MFFVGYATSPETLIKTFIANRISHIQRHSEVSQWWYVNTTQNPADLATRGLSVEQLPDSDLW